MLFYTMSKCLPSLQTIVGTDLADLLLQGHEPTTQEYRRTGMKITHSSDFLEVDDAESEDSASRVSRGTTPVDRSLVNKGRSLEESTDRFRHLLMYGRKKVGTRFCFCF